MGGRWSETRSAVRERWVERIKPGLRVLLFAYGVHEIDGNRIGSVIGIGNGMTERHKRLYSTGSIDDSQALGRRLGQWAEQ
jgi:hypothetical protein